MQQPSRTLCVLALVGLPACTSTAPSPPLGSKLAWDTALADLVHAIGERAVREEGIVGLSIGVAIEGQIVFAEGFGHANASRSVPATRDTMYDIASVGKHFTAAAILRLVEDGRLALDDRARDLIGELPDHFPNATVEQLLRHTSGFVSGDLDEGDPPPEYRRKRYGLELLTDLELQSGEARYEPGETWVYSNAGYLVAGLIVEVASGRRYDDFVREELLRPNGLDEMTVCEYGQGERMSERLRRSDAGEVEPVPFIDLTAYSGQGSICSSVVDLLRWSHALNSGQVVSPASLARMRSPSIVTGTHQSAEIPYGYGQRLGHVGPHAKAGHTGTFDGGSAVLETYPGAGLEIAVLANTRGGDTPHARHLELEIAKAVLAFVETPVASQKKPLSHEQRRQIEGTYAAEWPLIASTEGDTLLVHRGEELVESLTHIGDLRFRRDDRPDVLEWFLPDGDRAGWWLYDERGTYLEVLRRVE